MATRTTLAAIRFGYGLMPGADAALTAITDPAEMARQTVRPDPVEASVAGPRREERTRLIADFRKARRARRTEKDGAMQRLRDIRQKTVAVRAEDAKATILRPMLTAKPFRERLVAFWTDHFTVQAKNPVLGLLAPLMAEEAIRPHVGGRFAEMLKAVVRHPAMLIYLDQMASVGPSSVAGKRRNRGLNENLAREILELHTLGVDAGYSQDDVTEFAELLTGLSIDETGFRFRPVMAEPGAERVLGRSYGGRGPARLEDIDRALTDISLMPETAHHLARKLAIHFIGPDPEPALIKRMAERYRRQRGALSALYQTMLEDAAAWAGFGAKVKTPHEFVGSALRALEMPRSAVEALAPRQLRAQLFQPLRAMGQPPLRPSGPDGWPEEAEAWITPAALAARIDWAKAVADRMGAEHDPRALLDAVLPGLASRELAFLVTGAESRPAGVALILASAEFNRR